jgi:3-carboxy-cis,cis-muconate cycloisomerase
MAALLSALIGDDEIAAYFSDAADVEAMLHFEAALAQSQAKCSIIPEAAADAIVKAAGTLKPDMTSLAKGMRRDGVMAPSLVAQLRASLSEEHRGFVHFGATSQDATDSSLVLRLKPAIAHLQERLSLLMAALDAVMQRDGKIPLMAHTRMREAIAFTAGDKIETWLRPLHRIESRLGEIGNRLLAVQLGGPVGTQERYGEKADDLVLDLAGRLELNASKPWHSARDNIAEFGNWLSLLTGTLGKIGNDAVLLNQDKVGTFRLAGGGSSAMAHKQNPVGAEVLITLGRYNAGLVGLLHQSLIHENERSGAAWTLEWMVLPPMVIAAASTLRHAYELSEGMVFHPINE